MKLYLHDYIENKETGYIEINIQRLKELSDHPIAYSIVELEDVVNDDLYFVRYLDTDY